MQVNGTCDAKFEAVQAAFVNNFSEGTEQGASLCVSVGGEVVVDIWGGERNDAGDPWEADTIVNVYSTTKTMAAICMHMLADRGQLDFDAPVADYWPEFGAHGKEAVLVSHVMAHSAGLSGITEPIAVEDYYDHDKIVGLLADQTPWWEPGTANGYHAITQGYLQAEVLRRIDGRSLGTFFREEIAGPLGADFHIGLDAAHDARVGDLVPPPPLGEALGAMTPGSIAFRTFASAPLTALEPRTREWRAAEIPAAGGIGNARSVGRVHAAIACGGTLDGVTLMSPESVDRILEKQIEGDDLVLLTPQAFGLGFGLGTNEMPMPNERTFWWGGWGGSVAIIDLENQMTISYVMNKMAADLLGDTRGVGIVASAYAAALG